MRPIIVTAYNQAIDVDVVYLQQKVVNKFRKNIPFYTYNYSGTDLNHSDVCNKLVHKMFYEYQEGADCILILDIDCIPLCSEAIEYTFHMAYEGNLVGNIQRSNHYENNQHLFVAPSYICFTRNTFEEAGSPTLAFSKKYDVAELLSIGCRKNNIPIIFFMPTSSDSPNDDGEYWNLKDGMPSYGIGTTFSIGNKHVNYHLFCSRFKQYNHFFINTCQQIL